MIKIMDTQNIMTFNQIFMSSVQAMWTNLIGFLPALFVAIALLVVGIIVASLLGKLTTRIVKSLKVDSILTTTGLDEKLKKSDINFTISGVLGWIVKWFIIIATLLTVSGILNLTTISDFLNSVLLYIPNVLVAIVILTIGLIVANFTSELVEKSVKASEFVNTSSTRALRSITKWAIILFSVMAALTQLNIAPDLIQVLFTGIVMMFAIAGGLAFGLGGKDAAQRFIEKALEK